MEIVYGSRKPPGGIIKRIMMFGMIAGLLLENARGAD